MSAPVSPRTLRRQWLGVVGRLLIVPVVLMAFAAPSPGHIGSSCDDDVGPDAVTHCQTKSEIVCQRQKFRALAMGFSEETAEMAAVTCVNAIPAMCESFAFPLECQPTQMAVESCYAALFTNPDNPEGDNPPQCQTLCSGG